MASAPQATARPRASEVLGRGLDVLFCFLDAEGELGVSEIARRLGIAKSSVHRFLAAMTQKGLVTANPRTARYSLGFRVLELSHALTRQLDVVSEAQAPLRELRDATGESAALAVRVGRQRVHLTQAEGPHEIRQTFPIGRMLPIHAGAAGQVLLAYLPDAEIAGLLSRALAPYADSSSVDIGLLKDKLSDVRAKGYAISISERNFGSRAIAAPVWSWRGDVMALTVAGPEYRLTHDKALATRELLCAIAARLTRQLGGEALPPTRNIENLGRKQ